MSRPSPGSALYLASFRAGAPKSPRAFWEGQAKRALVIVVDSGFGDEAWSDALSLLREAGYRVWVMRSKEAPDDLPPMLEEEWDLGGVAPDLARHLDLVYLPAVSPGFVARIALGIFDEPQTQCVFHALLAGVAVIGSEDGAKVTSRGYRALGYTDPSEGLAAMLDRNLQAVRLLGMKLYPKEEAERELALHVRTLKEEGAGGDASYIASRVITKSDLLGHEGLSITVSSETMFTDLAREFLQTGNIAVKRRQEGT